MPDTIDPTGGEQLGALLAGVGGDPTQLYALLAQSLTTVTESNKQLQEMLNNQRVAQPNTYTKLEECPKKRKYCTMEAWIEEVKLWDV